MRPEHDDGWLSVSCDADDLAHVYLAVTEGEPAEDDWQPAFRDYDGRGRRTATIPYRSEYEGRMMWMKIDDVWRRVGVVRS